MSRTLAHYTSSEYAAGGSSLRFSRFLDDHDHDVMVLLPVSKPEKTELLRLRTLLALTRRLGGPRRQEQRRMRSAVCQLSWSGGQLSRKQRTTRAISCVRHQLLFCSCWWSPTTLVAVDTQYHLRDNRVSHVASGRFKSARWRRRPGPCSAPSIGWAIY